MSFMNRWIKILFTTGVLGFAFNVSAQFTEADFLKAEGTVLKNQIGDTINLRGTNLGSWLSLEYWMMPLGKGAISREGWAATASSTVEGSDIQSALDRDLSTGWTSAENQNGEQYFLVDMQQDRIFNRVSFEAGDFEDNYVRDYTIEVSSNLSYWQTASTGTASSGSTFVQLPNIYNARYIRITANSSVDFPWSIAEFNVFMEDDYHIRNALYDRFGVYRADTILDHFQDAWIQVSDLDRIKEMGMNMVRVPFYWMEIMYNDGTIKPHGFDQLDWVISECSNRDMYVILDLHGAPGGLNGFITSGQAVTNDLWTDATSQQMTIDIWKALANRYKNNPAVAGYDLMNEPLSSDQTNYPIHGFYDVLYDEVRAIDPDHLIIIGAFPGFGFVTSPEEYGWTNVMYQVHHYNEDKTNWASQNGFIEAVHRDIATHMYRWNVPVYAGEFNFWDFPDLWEKYISGLNHLNVSWSNWAYKVMRVDQPKENWGYYDSIPLAIPDIHYDSFDSIAYKWSQFTTSNARENVELKSIVRALTEDPVQTLPIGQTVWLQGSNLKYVSSEGNTNPMTCTRDSYDGWELFEIVDAGDGKVALLGSNNYYVNSQNGENSMMCNTTAIGEWEKFSFVQFTDNQIALYGNNERFVSSEDGLQAMNCNRESIGGWEVFNWGNSSTSSRVAHDIAALNGVEILVYPNPATDKVLINTDMESYTIELIDINGRLLLREYGKENEKVNVSGFSKGMYFLRLSNPKDNFTTRIIIE
ncbi:MAG TPA: glycoside hydrolase [Cytophagales bacterium]|nr:glycoside hydrolase [Cytophagales bacterium]